jgi:hypothetical protein
MATILSKDLKVKNGQIIKVQNDNRKEFSNEAKFYYALWVKFKNKDICIMMTQNEFKNANKILGSIDDKFDLGTVYTMDLVKRAKASKRYLIRVIHENEDETCLFLTEKQFNNFKIRGEKNIEDQPEKSWFTSIFN